jgi:hypothetical protein
MRSRFAFFVFVAVLAVALPIYLYYGRDRWFFFDEWDFLVTRDGGDIGDLLRAHNGHWVTLPIVAYRLLWRLVGLHSYLPYRLLLVVLHLAAAALLRVIMRRAGVDPWIATAAASLFALFGVGHQNVLWAFQICFVAALVFGLCQLVLVDHDGPVDWRDWLGVASGTAGLMCSGVGVTMVAVVGLAALTRRGWRTALLHTGPPALLYVAWWSTVGRVVLDSSASLDDVRRFVSTGLTAAFDGMGQVPGVGVLLGVVLAVGALLLGQQRAPRALRSRVAAPAALAVGSLMFLITSAFGRAGAHGADSARAGRYLHVVAALTLPAIGLAATAIAERWRMLLPVMVVCFLVGIPGNLRVLTDLDRKGDTTDRAVFHRYYRTFLLSAPRVPAASEVPGWVRLEPTFARQVTIGWLRDGVAAGRLPDPRPIGGFTAASVTLRLSLHQAARTDSSGECDPLTEPRELRLDKGDSFAIRNGAVRVVLLTDAGRSQVFVYVPDDGNTLEALSGPLHLRVQSDASRPATLCL